MPYHLADEAAVQIAIYDTKGVLSTIGYRKSTRGLCRSGKGAYWDGRNKTGEPGKRDLLLHPDSGGLSTQKMLILTRNNVP